MLKTLGTAVSSGGKAKQNGLGRNRRELSRVIGMFNLGRELAYRDVCIYQNPVAGEKKISAFHYMSIFTIKNCKQILNSSHKKKCMQLWLGIKCLVV